MKKLRGMYYSCIANFELMEWRGEILVNVYRVKVGSCMIRFVVGVGVLNVLLIIVRSVLNTTNLREWYNDV